MGRKASQFLTKEQRLKVYRKARKALLSRGYGGFCYEIADAAIETGISGTGKAYQFAAFNNDVLKQRYPEIAKRKPRTWYSYWYWFSPNNNGRKNSPRVRILTAAIKELEG